MSERDELAKLARDQIYAPADGSLLNYQIADAVLAAGYRKPRTVTAAQELDTIRVGAAIQTSDASDTVVLKGADGQWRNQDGADLDSATLWRFGTHPFTLIFEGNADV